MSLILIFLSFVFGVVFGAFIVVNVIAATLNLNREEFSAMLSKETGEQELNSKDELSCVEVTVEYHQGQLFAYRKSDNKFLAQAENFNDLTPKIAERVGDCVLASYGTTEIEDIIKKQVG